MLLVKGKDNEQSPSKLHKEHYCLPPTVPNSSTRVSPCAGMTLTLTKRETTTKDNEEWTEIPLSPPLTPVPTALKPPLYLQYGHYDIDNTLNGPEWTDMTLSPSSPRHPQPCSDSWTSMDLTYFQLVERYSGKFLPHWYGSRGGHQTKREKETRLGESARRVAVRGLENGQRWWLYLRWLFDDENEVLDDRTRLQRGTCYLRGEGMADRLE